MRILLILICLNFSLVINSKAENMTQAKADCEKLIEYVVPFTKGLLKKNNGLFPYGCTIGDNGVINMVMGSDGTEHPTADLCINLINETFIHGAKNNKFNATALVSDILITNPENGQKSDAILVAVDHKEHYSKLIIFPYKLQNGEYNFGQRIEQQGPNKVFEKLP